MSVGNELCVVCNSDHDNKDYVNVCPTCQAKKERIVQKMFERGVLSWHDVKLGKWSMADIGSYEEFVESQGGAQSRLRHIANNLHTSNRETTSGLTVGMAITRELLDLAEML